MPLRYTSTAKIGDLLAVDKIVDLNWRYLRNEYLDQHQR